MDTSKKNLVLMSLDEFILRKPNKATEEAMRQSESGKGLKKYKNLDELFLDLGI